MADVTVIGQGAFVRGAIRGDGDLEVHGRVEGEIEVSGNVTLAGGSIVKGSVSGRRVVAAGALLGNLSGSDAVRLEDGARVVGDVRSPSIGIAEGALLRGNVQTGDAESAPRAERRPAIRAAAAPATRPAATRLVNVPPTAREAARPAAPPVTARKAAPAPAPAASTRQGPPPPVVPALRRGAKGALKKKAR
jgi:cytoskeletal protein CcmA (bactofilin family)